MSAVEAQPLATVNLTTGWATFGQALPQGVAVSGLRVGTFTTQTDVKSRWPDGSIRFAIVSVYAPANGNYPIEPDTIASDSFAPNIPAASVALTIGAVTYAATLPAGASSDLWLSGPLVYEGRSVLAPLSPATGLPHPFLRVNFDTRVYKDGQARVDVSVENVLDQADAATVTYDAVIAVDGRPVFTKASVEHYYLTRWRKVFTLASTTLASITPDIAPFNASRALPPYLPLVSNVVSAPAGAHYDILQRGALTADMPAHGGRPELAPYPDWTARYLVHKDPTQRAFVLANGDLSGSWPIHVRESGSTSGVGSERLVSIDQRPNVWLDNRAQDFDYDSIKGTPLPIREYGSTSPGPGQSALIPDTAHQPSIAYVPYLMTGDRYYAEEMAFWANYSMVRTYPGDGYRGSQGLLAYNEVRGYGWALRNLVDAAAYYPDASPVKAYLSEKVRNNLQWLDAFAASQNPVTNPFQILWINKQPDGGQYISLWEQAYLAHAIDRANQQGFAGGLAHRDAIARFHLTLFTSEPDYPRDAGGAALIAVGTPDPANPALLGTFYTSMAEMWSATQGQERAFAGYHGPEARMNLMYGVQGGWPGAQDAYDYLWPFIGVNATSGSDSDLAQRAGWALDFYANGSGGATAAAVAAQTGEAAPGSTLAFGAPSAPAALPENVPDFSADTLHPGIESVQSGTWSSPATWQGGQVPTLNHVVRILQAHTVTIDDTSAVAYTIAVDGRLAFAPTVNTRLTVTNLEVMAGSDGMGIPGVLEVGTAANPIAVTATAEIVIADSPLGGGVPDPEQFGTGIIVFGKMIMHGSVRTPTFVRLATEPRAGHTTLVLAEAVSGWQVGDRLVLPDTRHIKESEVTGGGWINTVNQWEERTLQAVSADGKTLTLNSALQYDHLGARDLNNVLELLPHVGNLTRNVIVRSANPSGTRGHVIKIHMADADIRYALFKDLGRTTYLPLNTTTNHIGRYPIHMHHVSGPLPTPANGFQFTLLGNAVDGGSVETRFKWGIAVHGSHYGLIQDNVVYNYNGAAIATEDGSESFNVFDHNFALRGMGQPNDEVSEARMAMGTEGVGFWFRGPNNYVRHNVAANFQNPTAEAAYGFVFQFRLLGNIEVPNFKGADTMGTMGPGQSTTMNGNNLPLRQFENNEAYGAMQGGLTYWWINSQDPQPYPNALESVVKDFTAWHIYNKTIYIYPGQKVTFDGLKIRGNYVAGSRCCGDGVYFADYMAKSIVIRNSDIQGMLKGIVAPMSGFGPDANLTVHDTYLRNWTNVMVPTVGSVNGCWMDDKLVVLRNTRFDAAPGQTESHIAMVRDVANAPECLAKLDEVRVYAYNGDAADNFQIYHSDAVVLPQPPVSCTPTARVGISGPTCAISPSTTLPTATLSASPASIDAGQSTTLTWVTSNATSASIDQGIGTVATSGTRTVSPAATTIYTVTATDGSGSGTAAATVTVRTAPAIVWSAPPAIVSGTALGSSQLNATAGVAGSFVYSPPAGTILGAGASWLLSVTFTPADSFSYTTATATVSVTVTKGTPLVTWPVPADIVFGTPLGTAQLNATANVPGTFVYTPPAGTPLGVGPGQTLSVTFNPSDTTNYGPATASVSLNVTQAIQPVVWNAPATMTYPTALSAIQLNATAGVPGAFVYSPAAGTVLGAGSRTLSVTFTPTDASYAATTATVSLTVLKATPVVTWAPPENIVSGTPLGAAQLNATVASPPGALVYTPAAGTVLPVGPAQLLAVTFTPADTANFATVTGAVSITVVTSTSTPTPIKIGNLIAGTFNDATGHSGQSHLVFTPNASVWWLFTLSSAHDSFADHTVRAYYSSGPDLATATWTAAPASPNLFNAGFATNSLLAGGRSLGVALRTVGTRDYVHIFASGAFDGQVASNGHIRAELGAASIIWSAWNNPGSPNTASEWEGPSGTGNSSGPTKSSWGNSIGISTGGYIHHFSHVMDQEVDCAAGRSTNPDTAAVWTNGFGINTSPTGRAGTAPPWTTAVIDKTMIHQCKALTFAPLDSDVMLAVYTNGAVAQPNMTNLRYTKSGASGTWTNIAADGGGGHGNVFSTTANINHNDWALVPVSTTKIYAFRRNAAGTAITGASYAAATNNWAAMAGALAPPAFGTGQATKIGTNNPPVSGGLFGATDGTNVWLFVINTNTANSILYTRFNGTSWTSWATVPGTNTGTQVRNFISGYPKVGANQIGLVWTQGTGSFDVVATSLSLGPTSPSTVTLTAPAIGSTVAGSATVSATATPGSGTIFGVQFMLDGVALGAEDTTSPYSISWDTTTTPNGTHFLTAVARDTNGGTGTASTVTVTVTNDIVAPTVVMTTPTGGATVSGAAVPVSADASDDAGVAGVQFLLDGVPLGTEVTAAPYTLMWDTTSASPGVHTLAARARDAANNQTTSAAVSVAVTIIPAITWPAPAAIVYGTSLGATQLNATTGVPGTFVYSPAGGTVLAAGTRTLSTTFTPSDTVTYGTATASVTITVSDTAAPTVTVPPNATVEATSPAGAAYSFGASASDPVDGSVVVNCSPPSGTTFPLTATTVTCTATDRNGNVGSASFIVLVRDTTAPLVTAPAPISVPATEMPGARGNVAGSVGSERLAAFVAAGAASDLLDPAPVRLAPQVIVNGTPLDATVATLFPPGTTPVVFRFRDASGNIGTAASTVTVTARVADEPTVVQTTAVGGARLGTLQNPDGGWSFRVGSNACGGAYGTCRNTIGATALGLLAAYSRSGNSALLTAAAAGGDALVARYNAERAQTPAPLPISQDIEFLVALAQLTGNPVYGTTAQSWFQVAVDRFPNAADQIDDMVAKRNAQRLRSLAIWDAASAVRAAKAVGLADRAVAAAVRIRDLEPIWKDTNPAHRYDQCESTAGCGPADNARAFDYTILGEGSLLWAIHDLPGFDAQISEYRSFLLAQQDPQGSWNLGDSQMTAYVVMGLAAVGGAGANAAIASATRFFLANQLPAGGWPAYASPIGFVGAEYGEVDGEVVRAMAMPFSTPAGTDVSVVPSQLSAVTFSSVTAAGITTVVAIDQATAPTVLGGFEVVGGLTYQVATTATISGDITVCFSVPWISDPAAFADLRILHGETGVLVDRTILAPDQPAPDFASRRVCARTSSLSPFAVAVALPDTLPPVVTVPANATVEASGPLGAEYTYTASATDDADGGLTPACDPPSGTTFPVGSTTVVCTATDRAGNAGSASFVLTVMPHVTVNVAPVANSARYTTPSNTTLTGVLNATDVNGDRLTFEIVTNGSKGLVVVNAATGAFSYTPNRKAQDVDRFTFRVSDGKMWSTTATITVTITKGRERDSDKKRNER